MYPSQDSITLSKYVNNLLADSQGALFYFVMHTFPVVQIDHRLHANIRI